MSLRGNMQPFDQSMQPGQFSTFAPSKEDIMSALSFFFGKPAQPSQTTDLTEHHKVTEHLPDIYNGSNVHLRDTVNNLVLRSPESWQTTVALPFMQIDGVTVSWDSIHFDVRVMQRVPYEGASRMQTSIRRQHRDRIVRRGVALLVESDFYRTPEGRKYFSDQIKSIQYCVQVTCNYDVLFAYLTCHDYDFNWDLSKNLLPLRNVRAAMQKEITMYAVVQKQARGLDIAIEQGRQRMARYGVRPNMIVTVPETQLYLEMIPREKIVYNEAGPAGPAGFEAYRGNEPVGTMRGLNVHLSTPFDSGDNVDSVQMLRRHTQIGEYYVIKPPTTFTKKLPPTYMDLLIYDEQSDRLAHVPFSEAVDHAMPWALSDDALDQIQTKWREFDALQDRAQSLGGANKIAFGGGKGVAAAQRKAWWKTTLTKHVSEGGYAPVMIVVARPFIEHEMFSAIMTVAGRATGATLFGPADMQIAANATVKVIEGHYTCHTKAVITEPKNVMVLRDIQCAGYVTGSDITWFGDVQLGGPVQFSNAGTDQQMDAIRADLDARLDFDREYDNMYASMLAFAAPLDSQQLDKEQVFSIGATMLPWDVNNGSANARRSFPGGEVFHAAYARMFNLNGIQRGMDPQSAAKNEFIRNGTYNNVLCFCGPHRVYSPFQGGLVDLVAGQGHFGPDALPGDARWRRGDAVDVASARSELAGIDVATAAATARFGRPSV